MNRESVHGFLLNAHLIQVTLWTWQAHWSLSGPARHTGLTWHSSQISHYLPLWISCSHKPNQVAPLDLLGMMSFLLQPISSSRCFTSYLLNEMNREYDRSFLLNAHLKQVTLWTTGPTWHSHPKALWPNFSLVTPLVGCWSLLWTCLVQCSFYGNNIMVQDVLLLTRWMK